MSWRDWSQEDMADCVEYVLDCASIPDDKIQTVADFKEEAGQWIEWNQAIFERAMEETGYKLEVEKRKEAAKQGPLKRHIKAMARTGFIRRTAIEKQKMNPGHSWTQCRTSAAKQWATKTNTRLLGERRLVDICKKPNQEWYDRNVKKFSD